MNMNEKFLILFYRNSLLQDIFSIVVAFDQYPPLCNVQYPHPTPTYMQSISRHLHFVFHELFNQLILYAYY